MDISLNEISVDYTKKIDDYVKFISNSKYIFEVTKLCGYGEFILIHKDASLLELYNNISHQFECKDIKSLFFTDGVKRYKIPVSGINTIRKFITDGQSEPNLKNYFIPLYPLPTPVVYRIYFDDGHCHGENQCS